MKAGPASERNINRGALWFGFWGGGVAWLLHLLASYAIGEFGCTSEFRNVMALGITGVAWLLILSTVLMLALAMAAVLVAKRSGRKLNRNGAPAYLARAGLMTSGAFVFIILVQSAPIFFYLKDCGG